MYYDAVSVSEIVCLCLFVLIGAGCGDWTDANSAETLRPCQNDDVARIKGEEGDPNTCTRCAGKVRRPHSLGLFLTFIDNAFFL